mgnify:CR=1 FL=1
MELLLINYGAIANQAPSKYAHGLVSKMYVIVSKKDVMSPY